MKRVQSANDPANQVVYPHTWEELEAQIPSDMLDVKRRVHTIHFILEHLNEDEAKKRTQRAGIEALCRKIIARLKQRVV